MIALFCRHRARARFAGDSWDRDRLGQRRGSVPGISRLAGFPR
jgi:hypothetical protein